MWVYLIYLLIGAFAGSMSGLLGVGGGIVVVPALAFAYSHLGMPAEQIMHIAAATSLAAMIFTTSSSVIAHQRKGGVLWSVWRILLPGILIGTVIGAILASFLPTRLLSILFGVFLLLILIRMFMMVAPPAGRKLPKRIWTFLVSLIIGTKSGLFGVGGGVLTVPFLSYSNIPMRQAAGTSAACGLPIAIIGTISVIFTGHLHNPGGLGPQYFGYIYLPAAIGVAIASTLCSQIGAHFSHRLPTKILKRFFAIFLFVTAINLILG